MPNHTTKIHAVAFLALAQASGAVAANSAVPGPIILFAGTLTVAPLQWIAATMFMCIGVEAAIYRYVGLFRRPILASIVANAVSLVLGFPLAILGAVDPTWVILPTAVSIISEGIVLDFLPGSIGLTSETQKLKSKFWRVVIFANVATNVLMMLYLLLAAHRA